MHILCAQNFQVLLDSEDTVDPGEDAMLVSRLWIQGWLKRKAGSISIDISPTSALACPHGNLVPNAKRMAVPRYLWHMLKGLWEQAAQEVTQKAQQQQQQQHQPNGGGTPEVLDLTDEAPAGGSDGKVQPAKGATGVQEEQEEGLKEHSQTAQPAASAAPSGAEVNGGRAVGDSSAPGSPRPTHAAPAAGAALVPPCPDFPSQTSIECPQCIQDQSRSAKESQRMKRGIDDERGLLPELSANILPALEVGPMYYLIPRPWLQQWQEYVGQKQRQRAAAIPRPRPLPLALQEVLCTCHPDSPMLCMRPPAVFAKRNK
ncbi:hypothetical protein DUNSADRAFT_11623 [Dunaliella salina]|uniref:DUSP domain-containing protein n=1 Tax=Dunaliella salina TaxID=3046 RepID=A0ABQ7GCV7_DUNSA|nr:hypothetical protein DUNSADRAFT_11623 [Dunaliella salina]|eukprot:KAF5832456.1 hypothetical protein DUNSADRAFT_11623 [Dunaliella salina]